MKKMLQKAMCKKDAGGLNMVIMEGALTIVGIALVVVMAVAAKPIVEDFFKTCADKAKNIFTMF